MAFLNLNDRQIENKRASTSCTCSQNLIKTNGVILSNEMSV